MKSRLNWCLKISVKPDCNRNLCKRPPQKQSHLNQNNFTTNYYDNKSFVRHHIFLNAYK